MTNSIQHKNQKSSSKSLIKYTLVFVLSAIAISAIIGIVAAAYAHGNGSAYSTGYEIGQIIGSFVKSIHPVKGIGLGTLLSVLVSWDKNKSIGWAILHGILSWFYVAYVVLFKRSSNNKNS